MLRTSKHTFFWRGVFSNWHMSPFTVNDVEFNCGEQWMMFCKARLFKDKAAEKAIMASDNPQEIKKLGRAVANFDAEVWDSVSLDMVKLGLKQKFLQNDDLLDELLGTGETTLVEASPYDTIWGIGLGEDHPDIHDERKWKGQNKLGIALTDIRDEIVSDVLEELFADKYGIGNEMFIGEEPH